MRRLVLVTAASLGCWDEHPREPLFVPESVDIALAECAVQTFDVTVPVGPVTPLGAENLVARCEDASVCTATLRPQRARVVVRGLAAGTTQFLALGA